MSCANILTKPIIGPDWILKKKLEVDNTVPLKQMSLPFQCWSTSWFTACRVYTVRQVESRQVESRPAATSWVNSLTPGTCLKSGAFDYIESAPGEYILYIVTTGQGCQTSGRGKGGAFQFCYSGWGGWDAFKGKGVSPKLHCGNYTEP